MVNIVLLDWSLWNIRYIHTGFSLIALSLESCVTAPEGKDLDWWAHTLCTEQVYGNTLQKDIHLFFFLIQKKKKNYMTQAYLWKNVQVFTWFWGPICQATQYMSWSSISWTNSQLTTFRTEKRKKKYRKNGWCSSRFVQKSSFETAFESKRGEIKQEAKVAQFMWLKQKRHRKNTNVKINSWTPTCYVGNVTRFVRCKNKICFKNWHFESHSAFTHH